MPPLPPVVISYSAMHRKLLISLKSQFPGAVIHSHRDFAPKACPCFDATAEYASIA